MNRFALFLAIAFAAVCFGCHTSHRHKYLTEPGLDVIINGDDSVVASVVLPEGHFGLLFLNDEYPALAAVIASGGVELGVFSPGDYTLCLETYPIGTRPHPKIREEVLCVDFTIDGEVIPPEPPGEEPPYKAPKLFVRVNEDGVICVVVWLRDAPEVFLYDVVADETFLVDESDHFLFEKDCGDYAFELLDTGTEEVLARRDVKLNCPPDDCPEDPQLPPRPDDPRTRFVICHKGITKVVPWAALYAHLIVHGDTLGRCDDDD